MQQNTGAIAERTRLYRKLHRWVAVPLFAFMFLIGFTGLLLGWKKQTNLLPPTARGASAEPSAWLPLDSLRHIAQIYATDSLQKSDAIDRIDIRPQKGIAKIVFADHFSELQLDCTTGQILSVNARYSDILEKIHDGSILDYCFHTSNDQLKLAYTTIVSLSLLLLSFSGFWLWYNPKRIRKMKERKG
ncbi:MAG: PepSY domain-containing protein [Saprospiraceae bacterium]|nr:PepSY domain-containing protein [Saprospiraceae bacterium]